ncbi:MAG TPA: AAA family ATPase [Pyrinomonadaceae bacterium]|jgi:broad-specificity NMP kinase
MVVIINGSFGVGKTTVAKLLREAFPGSAVYDPEWAGLVLMRLPKWVKLKGAGTDDFQDIELWRRLTVAGVRLFGSLASGKVIVPMTFSRRAYLDEVVAGIMRHDPVTRTFCLRASLPTVKKRLAGRGTKTEGPGAEWIARRIVECAEAHSGSHFGEHVETEGRSAREVAEHIISRLRQSGAAAA